MKKYTEADRNADIAQEGKLEEVSQREFEINGETHVAYGWNEQELDASEKRIRKALASGKRELGRRARSSRWADDLD